jgi:hypothetical protein
MFIAHVYLVGGTQHVCYFMAVVGKLDMVLIYRVTFDNFCNGIAG